MRHIQITVSDEEYNIIKQASQLSGQKLGDFVKSKVLKSNRDDKNAPLTDGVEVVRGSKEKAWVYLQSHEKSVIQKNAEFHGWSASREIVFRLMSTMLSSHGEVVLYPDEVDALKKARNAVDTVGRNIKFIITGDRFVTVDDPSFRAEIRELLNLTSEVKETVNSMVNTVLNRWNKRKS